MNEDDFVALCHRGSATSPSAVLRVRLAQQPAAAPAARRAGGATELIGLDEELAAGRPARSCSTSASRSDFAAGHLRGAVNIGLRAASRNGPVTSSRSERDIVLVGDPANAHEAKVRLGRIGYGRVIGQLDDPASLAARTELHETSSRLTVRQLAELRGGTGPGAGRRAQLVRDRRRHARRRPRDPIRRAHRVARRLRPNQVRRRLLRQRLPLAGGRERPARRRGSPMCPICSAAIPPGRAPGFQ